MKYLLLHLEEYEYKYLLRDKNFNFKYGSLRKGLFSRGMSSVRVKKKISKPFNIPHYSITLVIIQQIFFDNPVVTQKIIISGHTFPQ